MEPRQAEQHIPAKTISFYIYNSTKKYNIFLLIKIFNKLKTGN